MSRWKKGISRGLILFGIALLILPFASGMVSRFQTDHLARRMKQEYSANREELEQIVEKARVWNEQLATSNQAPAEEDAAYQSELCFYGEGIMGLISIDKIDVLLPIYHGCSDQVLSKGAGHLPSSALPIGSIGGRSLISAHSGSAMAELFTRLDELSIGDWFSIENPLERLDYQVVDIEIVTPEQTESLMPQEGEDLVTLITCTPYGINSHRLLVTGKRGIRPEQHQEISLFRSRRFWGLVLILTLAGFGGIRLVQSMKKRKKHES